MRCSRLLALLLSPVPLAASAFAGGSVYTVDDDGPADFADLPAAVAAAADGDTLLVYSGHYSPFALDAKGLAIFAALGAEPLVDGTIVVRSLALGQVAILRGLATGNAQAEGLVLESNEGFVSLENGAFVGDDGFDPWNDPGSGHANGYAGALVADSARVAFTDVTLLGGTGNNLYDWYSYQGGGGPGLVTTDSNVAVFGGEVRGGGGGSAFYPTTGSGWNGAAGVAMEGGELLLSGSTVIGGQGGSGGDNWQWSGCGWGGDGGPGIHLDGGAVSRLDASVTGGGPGFGTAYYGCGNGEQGPASVIAAGSDLELSGPSGSLLSPAPLYAYQTGEFVFTGQPGELALLVFGWQADFTMLSELSGVLVIGGAPKILNVGALGHDGVAVRTASFSGVPPSLGPLMLHTQPAYVDPAGQVRLGAPSTALLIP